MYEHDADDVEMGNGEQQGDLGALAPQLGQHDVCSIGQDGTHHESGGQEAGQTRDGEEPSPHEHCRRAARILAVAALRTARQHVAASNGEPGL